MQRLEVSGAVRQRVKEDITLYAIIVPQNELLF
jgi:hypothetical protein